MKVEDLFYILTLHGYNARWYIPNELTHEQQMRYSPMYFCELGEHILRRDFWEALSNYYKWGGTGIVGGCACGQHEESKEIMHWELEMSWFIKRVVVEREKIADLLIELHEKNKHKII